jgi:ABC-type tungstate transport system substrate-binding protein
MNPMTTGVLLVAGTLGALTVLAIGLRHDDGGRLLVALAFAASGVLSAALLRRPTAAVVPLLAAVLFAPIALALAEVESDFTVPVTAVVFAVFALPGIACGLLLGLLMSRRSRA